MKVAFTSTTGEMIDEHFGMAKNFQIWEIGPEASSFLETVTIGAHGDDEEDKIAARAAVLGECAIVYTMAIGGPAAAKLVALKIHPMKTNSPVSLPDTVSRLQEVLKGNPPPWLRKAMNKGKGVSFDEE
ncbi:nitrogen fixation protein NifX [Geobacter hydrogenophilus]|uniref:Nitrogen fixation protein NifX n=1 Tax=Geobacter hydrogenophilus TaxID=40983 RepID=A0A9W6G0S3_9BACT|nr:nitrogen fixation protein NifX [Geobacter hydrogenophilus]MBT0892822.1 nitrogen fixation protein NifX [Geobacter hydrogenophilus]GLI38704.1 nitrogen fixation protein NifX [Geobacter hydrogenophilus]